MKKNKVVAFVLAASTTGGVIVANNSIANADEIGNNEKVMQAERATKTGTVVNVTSSLRVREGASTNTKVLGYLKPGQTVKIKGKSGFWYKIEFDNISGYVHSDYIKENSSNGESDSSNETITGKGKVVNVTTSLRVRSGASTSHSVIGYLNPGQTFEIKGRTGSWFKIKYDGSTGYIHKDYVEVLGNVDTNNGSQNGSSNTDKEETLKEKGKVINVHSNLRVRSSASTDSSVVGYLLNNENFDIIGKNGHWYKIKKNGMTGYIHGDYVEITSENSGETEKPDTDSGDQNSDLKGNIGQVINVHSNLRLRNAPNTDSSVVGYLLNGDKFEIIGKSGSWYKIKKDDTTGFVHGDYVKIIGTGEIPDSGNDKPESGGDVDLTNQFGIVVNVSSSLRFRESPSTNGSVIGYLLPGESVKVLSREGDWYKISSKGKIGYAHSDYIKLVEEGSGDISSPTYENIYNILSSQIGSPYVWGGKGELLTTASLNRLKSIYPDVAAEGRYNVPSQYVNTGYRAFDCSGLLYWAFNQVGINIGASTYDQIYAGREVSMNDIRPGDLLFYGNLYHVGMYIGDGKWIEAPYSGGLVRISNVPFNKVTRARRVID